LLILADLLVEGEEVPELIDALEEAVLRELVDWESRLERAHARH
jgi:hypothetical protein